MSKDKEILEQLTRIIWEETKLYNIDMRRKIPDLKPFFWTCYDGLLPEIRHEYLEWVQYLIENDLPYFSAKERHNQAIINRIRAGWHWGEVRDNKTKSDPYLIPLYNCPVWFQDWCVSRDNLMIKILKDNFKLWK